MLRDAYVVGLYQQPCSFDFVSNFTQTTNKFGEI